VGRHDRRCRLGIATGATVESLLALARVAPKIPSARDRHAAFLLRMHYADVPTMKPFWSISEACVWAATLDPDAVDAVNGRNPDDVHWLMPDTPPDAYSDHVLAWHSSLREGRPSVWEAYKQLPALCGDERLTMFGVARDDGDVEPIPKAAWAGLEISHNSRAGFVAEIPLNPGARWWTRLRLQSADVQRIWPPIEASLEQPSIVTAKALEPSAQRQSAGRKPVQRNRARGWIDAKYPKGVPEALSNAALVAAMKDDKIVASERTVIRARGGK
jgi:hypothetical protein